MVLAGNDESGGCADGNYLGFGIFIGSRCIDDYDIKIPDQGLQQLGKNGTAKQFLRIGRHSPSWQNIKPGQLGNASNCFVTDAMSQHSRKACVVAESE